MTNKFFPEEQITENDLYFLCYMIERVARKLHQKNKYVVNSIAKDEWVTYSMYIMHIFGVSIVDFPS